MTPPACHRCGRAMAAGEGRPIPKLFRLAAAFSLAAVHAGMWLWEDLSRDHCPRCRRWLSFLAALLAAIVLTAGIMGLRWLWTQGLLFNHPK